jgi:hypothetical protein
MRLLLAVPLLACGLSAREPNSLTAEERAAGWVLLFDGRSTAGWTEVTGKPFPAAWTVEDGCLRALAPASKQDLRAPGVYRYFELRWQWKLAAKGNSGVKYLVQKFDEWTNAAGRQARARGLEYQIYDDSAAGEGAGDPAKQCGALYGIRAATAQAARPLGEFNESRIVVRRARVEHWLNGVKIVDFSTTDPAVRVVLARYAARAEAVPEGYLSLQNHGGLVWFRDLKVCVLAE